MKIFSRGFVQVAVLIVMIAFALPAQATTYSKASLKGGYSFLTNLWTADASTNQVAMVGVLTFDGAGKVTGSYTSLSLEVFKTGTLAGTYAVSSNGTGTITFKTGSTAKFAVALNNPTASGVAQGVQLLQTNDSNNEVVSGTAVLQSPTTETYSVASLNGNFSFQWNLWTAEVSASQASLIATGTFDGKGGFKGTHTTVMDGKTTTGTDTGTYTVSPDGSASLSLSGGTPTQVAFALNAVAAGQAKGMQVIINLSPGKIGSGSYVTTGIGLSMQATKFSKASLKGGYSFLTNLWTADTATDEISMVGVLTFNGAGKVAGSYTSVSMEVLKTGALGGTYTVSSNGTGTITFTSGLTSKYAIALNNPTTAGVAQGVQLLQTNDSNNEVVAGTAVLQSTTAQTYSVASVEGNFSFQWNLWWPNPSGYQGADIGTVSFDGKGGFKDSYTGVLDGKVTTKTGTGTYTVSADGTCTISMSGGEVVFVLNSAETGLAQGAQFIYNLTESGNYVISGIALKQ